MQISSTRRDSSYFQTCKIWLQVEKMVKVGLVIKEKTDPPNQTKVYPFSPKSRENGFLEIIIQEMNFWKQ